MSIAGLVILTLAIGIISCAHPQWLSDDNSFLKGFVNHELLSVLGVIVTMTLAWPARLHLELNRMEDGTGEEFKEARSATKAYAYLLIGLFTVSLALVVLKPLLAINQNLEAVFNGGAILIIALNILSWLDLTGAVLAIPSDRKIKE